MIKQSIIGLILLSACHGMMGQGKRIHLKGILTARNGDPHREEVEIIGGKGLTEWGVNGDRPERNIHKGRSYDATSIC